LSEEWWKFSGSVITIVNPCAHRVFMASNNIVIHMAWISSSGIFLIPLAESSCWALPSASLVVPSWIRAVHVGWNSHSVNVTSSIGGIRLCWKIDVLVVKKVIPFA
jgi:hypothetical protein